MKSNLDMYDTSNYPQDDRNLHSDANNKVVGKFKDECAGVAALEFVGLRAKMYSLKVTNNDKKPKMTAKGISRNFVKHHVRHQHYLHTLKTGHVTRAKYYNFRSTNHRIRTVEINKVCLSAFDNKRYILDDGISTLAYGHYRINEMN